MQTKIKKLLFVLYALVIVCMAAATIVEKYQGSDFVGSHIYGAWWFTMLWALLAATAIVYFIKHRTRSWTGTALHISFVVILAGAFITHISSERGMIHLRQGLSTNRYTVFDRHMNPHDATLPFDIRLDRFDVQYHAGTDAAQDYVSHFTLTDNGQKTQGKVSMNNIFSYGPMRIYQASYDSDGMGATLSTNSDPIGIPVTYTGYALLFVALIGMLIDPRGAYRQLLRHPVFKKGALFLTLLFATAPASTLWAAGTTDNVKAHYLPEATAEQFGRINILYNSRICPVQTVAIDFTKKLYGARSYKGLTAEQVFTGWIFWGEEWMNEPLLKIKDGEMKSTLQLPDYVSANNFFNNLASVRNAQTGLKTSLFDSGYVPKFYYGASVRVKL